MRPSRILYFSLAVSLLLQSCSSTLPVFTSDAAGREYLRSFSPIEFGEQSMLFKSGIDIYGRHLSGLVLIKPLPGRDGFRIVLLSELGLNLLDMVYKKGEFSVVSVKEFLDRKMVLKALQHDFRTLLLDLSLVKHPRVIHPKPEKGATAEVLKFRLGLNTYRYYRQENGGTTLVRSRKGCFSKSELHVDRNGKTHLTIEHGRGRMKVEMNELNRL
jgi:hypothetical protein